MRYDGGGVGGGVGVGDRDPKELPSEEETVLGAGELIREGSSLGGLESPDSLSEGVMFAVDLRAGAG